VAIIRGKWSDRCTSIREFCDVKVPILMFTKNDSFVVMTMEEVPAPIPLTFLASLPCVNNAVLIRCA